MTFHKFSKIGLVAVVSLVLITGCTGIEVGGMTDSEPSTNSEQSEETPDFDIIGEVLQIDGNEVHVIFGDIVEIYSVDNANDIYLGQMVKIIDTDEETKLEPYLIQNFELKHTNMGDMIETATGTLESLTEDELVLKTESKTLTLKSFGTYNNVEIGDLIDLEYIQAGVKIEDMTVLEVLPLKEAMNLTVESLERMENGLLVAKGADEEGMKSFVEIKPGTNDNFNMTELKAGDVIEVIPEIVMESYPMQIVPLRVKVIK